MWAMQLDRPRAFQKVDVPAPTRNGSQDVLLRTIAGAICGSDLPYFAGAVSPLFDDSAPRAAQVPGYPLHEVAGEVLESDVAGIEVGQAVVGWATRTDALAELTVTEASSLIPVPPWISAADSVILQPLACVVDTLARVGDLEGRHVAVVGLGPFGLLFSHVARSLGAASITGVDLIDRRAIGATFGIDRVVHSRSDRWASAAPEGPAPEVVIEAVGHQTHTLNHIIDAAAPGARIFYFGVPDEPSYPLAMQKLFRKGLTLTTGTVEARQDALLSATRYLHAHPDLLTSYVTHSFPADRATEAFAAAAAAAPDQVKVRLLMEPVSGE
jgi:threonine dehydrogenase-like Zn-dependent dehydrogenase